MRWHVEEMSASRDQVVQFSGCLESLFRREAWFDGMDISYEGTTTTLTGLLEDQAALHGILNRIRDLNLKLLSVEQIDCDPEDKK